MHSVIGHKGTQIFSIFINFSQISIKGQKYTKI